MKKNENENIKEWKGKVENKCKWKKNENENIKEWKWKYKRSEVNWEWGVNMRDFCWLIVHWMPSGPICWICCLKVHSNDESSLLMEVV